MTFKIIRKDASGNIKDSSELTITLNHLKEAIKLMYDIEPFLDEIEKNKKRKKKLW